MLSSPYSPDPVAALHSGMVAVSPCPPFLELLLAWKLERHEWPSPLALWAPLPSGTLSSKMDAHLSQFNTKSLCSLVCFIFST
jgi:hypothetical protein